MEWATAAAVVDEGLSSTIKGMELEPDAESSKKKASKSWKAAAIEVLLTAVWMRERSSFGLMTRIQAPETKLIFFLQYIQYTPSPRGGRAKRTGPGAQAHRHEKIRPGKGISATSERASQSPRQ